MATDIFSVLADPTRRHLLSRLATGGPATATALAADLDITRQAVAKHLGILTEVGMAHATRVGRETRFEAELGPLDDVRNWIAGVEGAWSHRLELLAKSIATRSDR